MRYGAKIENQARDIFDHYRTPLVEVCDNQLFIKLNPPHIQPTSLMWPQEKRVMLEKRAIENGKIAKKAIADGISVLKSNENNPTDVAKGAMEVMTKSAKNKVIKKTKGNL